MTKKNLKNLVQEIKKLADASNLTKQAIIRPPGSGGGGTATTTTSVTPNGAGYGGDGKVTIMTMQHALQDLAKDVSSQINLQDAFSGDPKKEQEAKERDAFGVFLTKNYMRNTKVPGIEYDPDPKITDVSQKRPDDPTRMSVVMDTMNRVGTPKKGEKFVDGGWGPRTNAAIRDVYAFASGLFDFVDDVNRFATRKLHISSYNKTALQELASMAKEDPNALTSSQKLEAAPLITKHVKAIKSMYDEVKNQILQHPVYQQFIEGTVPFKSYQPKVTQQQIDLLKNKFPDGFDVNIKNVKTKIPVDALVKLDALKNWISTTPSISALNPSPQEVGQEVVGQVWKQQEKLLGSDPGF